MTSAPETAIGLRPALAEPPPAPARVAVIVPPMIPVHAPTTRPPTTEMPAPARARSDAWLPEPPGTIRDPSPLQSGNRVTQNTSRALSGSLWLLARTGDAPGFSPGGQLGGSQAGLRLWLPLDDRILLTGRLSAALTQPGREAALGAAWRQKVTRRGVVGMIVERRIALDRGGRDAFGALVFAGFDAVPLAHDFRLDGYAQAGVVERDAFADGALRVERTLYARGPVTVAAGAGAWGAAQPGATRLDVGPQLVATLPIAERRVRLSAEWRFRVGGDARPGSGPALTIGTDF